MLLLEKGRFKEKRVDEMLQQKGKRGEKGSLNHTDKAQKMRRTGNSKKTPYGKERS